MTNRRRRCSKQRRNNALDSLISETIGQLRVEFAEAIDKGTVQVEPQGTCRKTLGWAAEIYIAVKLCKIIPYPDLVAAYAADRAQVLLHQQITHAGGLVFAQHRIANFGVVTEDELRRTVWDFARNLGFLHHESEHKYAAHTRHDSAVWARRPMTHHPREFDDLCNSITEHGLPKLRTLAGPAKAGILNKLTGERTDLIIGSTLLDIKTVQDPRKDFNEYLRQLLHYAFTHKFSEITHIGLYLVGQGVLFVRSLPYVLNTGDSYDLKACHNRYREVLHGDD